VLGIVPDITDDRRYTMEVSLRRIKDRLPSLIHRESDFFSDMERRMGSLFDNVFGTSLVSYVVPETRGVFSPRIDIKETKKEFKIVSEIPGMDPKDIDVSVHDGMLTISGEKTVEKEEKETDYCHIERSYGYFSRSVRLPDTVDIDNVKTNYRNGLLTISLNKTDKPIEGLKKIPVVSS
jgi:HSP20 family protein